MGLIIARNKDTSVNVTFEMTLIVVMRNVMGLIKPLRLFGLRLGGL